MLVLRPQETILTCHDLSETLLGQGGSSDLRWWEADGQHDATPEGFVGCTSVPGPRALVRFSGRQTEGWSAMKNYPPRRTASKRAERYNRAAAAEVKCRTQAIAGIRADAATSGVNPTGRC